MMISAAIKLLAGKDVGIYRTKPNVVLIPTNSLDGVQVWISGQHRNIVLPQWSPRKDDLTASNWTILPRDWRITQQLSRAHKYTQEEWRNENEEKA